MNSFIKDFRNILISKIAIIAFGLGSSVIAARWIGPDGNGIIAAIAVYPSLFMTFGSLGIRQSATFFTGKKIFPVYRIRRAIVQIWFFSVLFCVLSSFFLIRDFSNSGNNLYWVLLAIAPIPFSLFNTYQSGMFLGENKISEFNRINWLPVFASTLFTFILVVVFNQGIAGVLIAAIAGPILMTGILMVKYRFFESFSLHFELQIFKKLFSLGIIYAIALLLINFNYQINTIMLDKFATSFELGIYSKGANIVQYLWQIPMLLSTIVFARSSNSKDELEFSYKVAKLLRISIIFIGTGSIILMILSKQIIILLFGDPFITSSEVLIYLLPGVLLLTVFKVLNMDLAGKGKPWISLKAMIPALCLNIAIGYFLIPKYGANGAAIASTCSYSFAAMLFLFFYSKQVNIPIFKILSYQKSDFTEIISQLKSLRKK